MRIVKLEDIPEIRTTVERFKYKDGKDLAEKLQQRYNDTRMYKAQVMLLDAETEVQLNEVVMNTYRAILEETKECIFETEYGFKKFDIDDLKDWLKK